MDPVSTGPRGEPRPAPSGLFPSGPPRPVYREPHPVRPGRVLVGAAGGGLWMTLFTLLGSDLPGHVWWTVTAGMVGWLSSLTLARYGDRGVAVGVAVAVAVGWVAAAGAVTLHWAVTGDWPLW